MRLVEKKKKKREHGTEKRAYTSRVSMETEIIEQLFSPFLSLLLMFVFALHIYVMGQSIFQLVWFSFKLFG